jgi:RNA-directed DNA polymerase
MKNIMQKLTSAENMNKAWRWFRNDKTVWQSGMRRAEMEPHKVRHVLQLQQDLVENRFKPDEVRRFTLKKANGKERELAALTLKDKIAQRALLQVLSPHFEKQFHQNSFGYRPGRNTDMAFARARMYLTEGNRYLVHTDIKSFFDRIPHASLKQVLKKQIRDKQALQLINQWLQAHATRPARWWRGARGVPQGGILSPLLGNIYLNQLDQALTCYKVNFVRYADDVLLLESSPRKMKRAARLLKMLVAELGLTLNPDKTFQGEVRKGQTYLGHKLPHLNPRAGT